MRRTIVRIQGKKRKKSQSGPKNTKKRKVADPIGQEQTPWETLPKEIWEAIFESFDDDGYYNIRFEVQPRIMQLEFLRVVSRTLNKRCKEYLERVDDEESMHHVLADVMASRGYLSCLKYLIDDGFHMTHEGLAGAICDGPHMDVVKYAVEVLKVPWSYYALRPISKKDNVELLKYAYKTGGGKEIDWMVAEHAAKKGSLQCLKFMKEIKIKMREEVLTAAALSGSLECVKFLHKTRAFKLKPGAATCAAAAEAGSLEILKYCRENGAPWDEYTIYNAADKGHINCVEYAIQNKAPVDKDALEAAMAHYDCLKAVHQYMGEWPEEMSWAKATYDGDRVECFQYAHENGAPWSEDTCADAASYGAINCLKYAHENGAPWSEKVCQQAVWDNHLDCLIYCHENGAPWDSDTAWSAARHPTIDCLKYCHEHGCPWDSSTLRVAAHNSGMACLKYAAENGCPRGDDVCGTCYDSEVRKYLHENEICTCKKK